MWLLNHGAARKFEIPMLKRIGFNEIFLPKRMPADISFRSGSVDFSEDEHLTIPTADLAVLNEVNWYGRVPAHIWDVANRHFNILFFIAHDPAIFASVADHFEGAAIWRAYGLDKTVTYTKHLRHCSQGFKTIEKLGKRFWFGEAYAHLHEIEHRHLQERAVYLPLGTHNELDDQWIGDASRIFFVCPQIKVNSYYQEIYKDFKKSFGDLPHAIGGTQPIAVDDPDVLGFVSKEEHEENMRQFRVMYYHSTEPNHVHYHPFEAIQLGMPLVFQGGGLLDRLGGTDLPGRCVSVAEARDKIKRILDGDRQLIDDIRTSQMKLLKPMNFAACETAWRVGFKRIMAEMDRNRLDARPLVARKRRIAVILPHVYRGGTLRGAKLVAEALAMGSRACGEEAEVVFAHIDDSKVYSVRDFEDLPKEISVRPYRWISLDQDTARRAMRYAGHRDWVPARANYITPDDGIRQFSDCDLLFFVSDRIVAPLLPIRPHVVMPYDYLQRYVSLPIGALKQMFIANTRSATTVLVTTEFTRRDAIQFAGIGPDRVMKVPMLAPEVLPSIVEMASEPDRRYFIWTTNIAPHKNHIAAFEALRLYYEDLRGTLACHITGTGAHTLLTSELPNLKPLADTYTRSASLQQHVKLRGELTDRGYFQELAGAAFLWHPTLVDNGTFSVIEAARLGVPSLSSDYPAMREIDAQFGLQLAYMDRNDPRNMATQLKWMEVNLAERRSLMPSADRLATQRIENLAPSYWKAVRECL